MLTSRLTLRFSFLVIALLFSPTITKSQVQVALEHPPLNQLKTEDLWKIQLINSTQTALTVFLKGSITSDVDGVILDASCAPFLLKPGLTRIRVNDLKEISLNYNKTYEETLIKTGSVPEGNYEICVSVINAEDKTELGKGCIMQNVIHAAPPQLVFPENEKSFTEPELASVVFQWIPPAINLIKPGNISYNLRIVQLSQSQMPETAIENNPAWFEKREITTASFRYPVSARKFEKGNRYAWQISMMSDNTNIGTSEVYVFSISDILTSIKITNVGISNTLLSAADNKELTAAAQSSSKVINLFLKESAIELMTSIKDNYLNKNITPNEIDVLHEMLKIKNINDEAKYLIQNTIKEFGKDVNNKILDKSKLDFMEIQNKIADKEISAELINAIKPQSKNQDVVKTKEINAATTYLNILFNEIKKSTEQKSTKSNQEPPENEKNRKWLWILVGAAAGVFALVASAITITIPLVMEFAVTGGVGGWLACLLNKK